MTKRDTKIAGEVDDQLYGVTTVEGGGFRYRREPCEQCPWRKDSPRGAFPAEAYRISANTAYDMATHTFACHMSGPDKPAACAGFLLRGALHNLTFRLRLRDGQLDLRQVSDGGHPLYESYRAMAIANGVDPRDPALVPCRDADR